MAVDVDALGDTLPGGGPSDKLGPIVAVPVPTTSVSVNILTVASQLMGWSFREATGLGVAVAELLDGGDDNGGTLACLNLSAAFDPAASQTPASATATGAASAIAPSIGGAAGTLAFVQSLRIGGTGATAASVVAATLTGVLGGTLTYEVSVPAGAGAAVPVVSDAFPGRGLQASASGVAITLNVPSFGAGNTFSEAEVQGYVQTAAEVADTQRLGDEGIRVLFTLRLRVVSGSLRGAVWIRR